MYLQSGRLEALAEFCGKIPFVLSKAHTPQHIVGAFKRSGKIDESGLPNVAQMWATRAQHSSPHEVQLLRAGSNLPYRAGLLSATPPYLKGGVAVGGGLCFSNPASKAGLSILYYTFLARAGIVCGAVRGGGVRVSRVPAGGNIPRLLTREGLSRARGHSVRVGAGGSETTLFGVLTRKNCLDNSFHLLMRGIRAGVAHTAYPDGSRVKCPTPALLQWPRDWIS